MGIDLYCIPTCKLEPIFGNLALSLKILKNRTKGFVIHNILKYILLHPSIKRKENIGMKVTNNFHILSHFYKDHFKKSLLKN